MCIRVPCLVGVLIALPQLSVSFCTPVASRETQRQARQREWDDFSGSNSGKWRGEWTTFDGGGVQQGRPDRLDTHLEQSANRQKIRHVKTLFVGSVDSECSRCFDSVETTEIQVGEYTNDTFRHRACHAAYILGPGVTPRGDMSVEVGFRHGDTRLRFIVVHRPPLEQLQGPDPPSQLALERIVLVKETLTDDDESHISPSSALQWRSQLNLPNWLGVWRGSARVLENDVDGNAVDGTVGWRDEDVRPTHFRRCRCSGQAGNDEYLSLELDGRIRLEAPKLVCAGVPADTTFVWVCTPQNEGETQRIVQGKLRVEALTRVVDEKRVSDGSQRVTISPPQLLRFAVEDLEPVASAGL